MISIPEIGGAVTTTEEPIPEAVVDSFLLTKEVCQSKTEIKDKVDCYADLHKVDRELAHYIVSEESEYNPKAVGDMYIHCERTNSPVKARGLMQITRCYHPNVTDAQAFDADENLDYGMKLASKKSLCRQQFSTCDRYYNL